MIMICNTCGRENNTNGLYCSFCGAPLKKADSDVVLEEKVAETVIGKENMGCATNTVEQSVQSNDGQYDKVWALLGYLSLVGWLISLAAAYKKNDFVLTHQNNSIVVLIFSAVSVLVMCIPIIGWVIGLIALIWLTVDTVIGIVWSIQGINKEIPLFGKIHILK